MTTSICIEGPGGFPGDRLAVTTFTDGETTLAAVEDDDCTGRSVACILLTNAERKRLRKALRRPKEA